MGIVNEIQSLKGNQYSRKNRSEGLHHSVKSWSPTMQ